MLDLYHEEKFENLFKKLYADAEEIKRKTDVMYTFYSLEEEAKYGVLLKKNNNFYIIIFFKIVI